MELDIISFNIRGWDDSDGNSIAERAPRLNAITSRYDADIIGFQEYCPKWEEYIVKFYGKEYEILNQYRAEEELESSPILWKRDKFECIGKGRFWFSDTPEVESKGWDERYDCYRMCLYVILKHRENEKCFTVMNTHFGFGDKGQVASAKLLYEYRKMVSPFPTIVIGDFNMRPDSDGYAEMTKYFVDVNAATKNDLRTTYHGYHLNKYSAHIDYCFVSEGVKPINQKLIDDLFDGKFPSDHYGLHIQVKLV